MLYVEPFVRDSSQVRIVPTLLPALMLAFHLAMNHSAVGLLVQVDDERLASLLCERFAVFPHRLAGLSSRLGMDWGGVTDRSHAGELEAVQLALRPSQLDGLRIQVFDTSTQSLQGTDVRYRGRDLLISGCLEGPHECLLTVDLSEARKADSLSSPLLKVAASDSSFRIFDPFGAWARFMFEGIGWFLRQNVCLATLGVA
jgi:hypothetical protein